MTPMSGSAVDRAVFLIGMVAGGLAAAAAVARLSRRITP